MTEPLPTTEANELDANKHNKLSQDVYSRLKQGIFDFRLPPGQRYSEASLADMLSVSRTPLRLALHVLEHEGYLQKLGGHNSWQVKPLDLSYYEDLYDFRSELEGLAIRLAQDARSTPQFAAVSEFWRVDKADRSFDSELVAEQDEKFHLAIVSLANNRAMLRTFADLTDRIRIIRRLDFTSNHRINVTYDEHETIINSILSGNKEEAASLIRQHIDTSREEIRRITVYNMAISRNMKSAI